jgi:uncharacterized protein (TIGR00369 family)
VTTRPDDDARIAPTLTDADQAAMRAYFHAHWEMRVPFNRSCGIRVPRWEPDGVEFRLPYRDDLSAHPGIFHGGVVSALIDTCGCGAVMAGHDYSLGSRLTTVSLTVHYLSVAPGEDMVADGHCTRRGRTTHYAEVHVRGSRSGKPLAEGLVAVNISGHRADFAAILDAARRDPSRPQERPR